MLQQKTRSDRISSDLSDWDNIMSFLESDADISFWLGNSSAAPKTRTDAAASVIPFAPEPIKEQKPGTDTPVLTSKQLRLRSLNRKQLIALIGDLEKELRQAKQENENMILAYQAGLAQIHYDQYDKTECM